MDDLSAQLNQILSDPQKLQQIQSMAGALGMGGPTSQPAPPPVPAPAPPMDAGALQLVGRLSPLLGQLNREDDHTRLLLALRPLLSPARQQKLDEASRILRVMRLLPLLRQSGALSGLL